MARRKQFTQLQSDLRAELGRNNDPSVRAADLPQIKQTLSRVYESLYREYDWPFLRQVFTRIPLAAGQRHYDFPDDLDFDRIEKVVVWHNEQPIPLIRGIELDDYATYDSENDDRSDPVVKWDVRFTDPREQIEVWPIPAGNDQELQFVGITKFIDLVDDADQCLLDDNLVVLFAAIELETNEKRRQAKIASAQSLFSRLKGRSKSATETVRLGLGSTNPPVNSRAVVRVSG